MKLILMLICFILAIIFGLANYILIAVIGYLLGVAFFVSYLREDEPEEIYPKSKQYRKL